MQAECHLRYGITEQSLIWTTITTAKLNVSHMLVTRYIQGVSGGIVNILGGGSMDYSE